MVGSWNIRREKVPPVAREMGVAQTLRLCRPWRDGGDPIGFKQMPQAALMIRWRTVE
jgi:hypothetical protein